MDTLLEKTDTATIEKLITQIKNLSDEALSEQLAIIQPVLRAQTERPDKSSIREKFRLELYSNPSDFVTPPRKHQRNWMLGQAMAEFSDDLEHLDALASDFVPGIDQTIELSKQDITHSALSENEIMEDWQVPLMQAMADYVCETHGDILEIGFGRGVSAEMIQQKEVRSHTIVEVNDHSINAFFHPWAARYPNRDIRLKHALWQDVEPELGEFDGIFFHSFPLNEKDFEEYVLKSITFAEHAIPVMAKHLKTGGVFSYLSLEIDSLSRRHQRLLFRHFSSITTHIVNVNVPGDNKDIWWSKTMVAIKAVK